MSRSAMARMAALALVLASVVAGCRALHQRPAASLYADKYKTLPVNERLTYLTSSNIHKSRGAVRSMNIADCEGRDDLIAPLMANLARWGAKWGHQSTDENPVRDYRYLQADTAGALYTIGTPSASEALVNYIRADMKNRSRLLYYLDTWWWTWHHEDAHLLLMDSFTGSDHKAAWRASQPLASYCDKGDIALFEQAQREWHGRPVDRTSYSGQTDPLHEAIEALRTQKGGRGTGKRGGPCPQKDPNAEPFSVESLMRKRRDDEARARAARQAEMDMRYLRLNEEAKEEQHQK